MSWSATGSVNKDEIDTITVSPQTQPEGCEDAFNDQRSAAFEAAKILAKAVGGDSDRMTISMSGHANPNHEPATGWADEMITVSVRK